MSVPIALFIFLLIDGWDWLNFLVLALIITLWVMYLADTKQKLLAWINLVLILGFDIFLFTQASWYLFGFLSVVFVLWFVLLQKPELKDSISTYVNLLITMLLGGLWHGASTRFIIWGALHGIALAVHKLWMDASGTKHIEPKGFRKFAGQFLTFHFICFCWIYFRAANMNLVNTMIKQIGTSFQFQVIPQILAGYKEVFILMLIAYIIHWIPRTYKDKLTEVFITIPDYAKAFIIALIVIGLYQSRTAEIQPFIYFQF